MTHSSPANAELLNEADVLASIGGWRVGCERDIENRYIVGSLDVAGYLTIRRHFAPATPDGDPAYELTTQGLRRLAQVGTPEQFRNAVNMRDWYRAKTSIPAQQMPEPALGYATRLLEHFVAEHFPHNPDWKPLPELIGVLTQLDNAMTIARDYKERLRAYEGGSALTSPGCKS